MMTNKEKTKQGQNDMRKKYFKLIVLSLIILIPYVLIISLIFVLAPTKCFNQLLNRKDSTLIQNTQIIGFFKEDTTQEQIQNTRKEIQNLDYVIDVKYTSKDDALKLFLEKNHNKELTESIDRNIFPQSITVKVNSPQKVESIIEILKKNKYIESHIVSDSAYDD